MPQVPLRRKFVQELDDIDQSHKRPRLSKYLGDRDVVNVQQDVLTSDSDGKATSNTSDISSESISSISSISSLSSDSDSDTSLSLTPSGLMEDCLKMVEEEIHKLRKEIAVSRRKPSQKSKVIHSILAISIRALTYSSARSLHLPCSCLVHCFTPCSVSVHFCDQHPPRRANLNMLHSAELGIDADFISVNLLDGENFKPEYLKLVSCSCLRTHQAVVEALFV